MSTDANWMREAAVDIASRVHDMHLDCVVNNEALIRGLIRNAFERDRDGTQATEGTDVGAHVDAIDRVNAELEREQSQPA